jgi:hypothetical protein
VERDRPDILQDFRERFRGWARVIQDRRGIDPAGATFYDGPERRRPPVQRRSPFAAGRGYRLVIKVDGFELHELIDAADRPPRGSFVNPI